MPKTKKDRRIHERIAIDIAGFSLIIISPFLGWLPGPGGIPLFLAGLGLVSLNHEWAENLLKDFEKRREAFTTRYLLTSPRVSYAIDFACVLAIAIGAAIGSTQESILLRGVGFGLISFSIIVLISNQQRFERIAAWYKSKRKDRTH